MHFAGYPIDLLLRCTAAGCKPGVLDRSPAAARPGSRHSGSAGGSPRCLWSGFARLAAERIAEAVADQEAAR
jgi:hypothetical protein